MTTDGNEPSKPAVSASDAVPSGLIKTGFMRLWVGDFVSNAGSSMVVFAVPIIAVTELSLSAAEVSRIVAASLSAPLFVALSAGVIADRVKRSLLLQLCNLGRFLIFAALLWMLLTGTLGWVSFAAGLFLVGVFTLLYESAMAAAVPAIVPRDQLIKANSWIEGGLSISETGSPVVAGAAIKAFGSPVILAFNALGYVFSSLMLLGLPLDRRTGEGESQDAGHELRGLRGHLREIQLGFSLLWNQIPQRVVLLAATIYNFFDSWLLAIFPVFALTVLGLSPFILGLVFVVPTITGIVASGLAFRLTQRFSLGKLLTASFCLIALAGLALCLTTVVPGFGAVAIMTAVFAVFEFCIVVNLIIGRTMRQTLYPERHISKIMGTTRFVSWGVDPIGALAGGAVSTFLGLNASVVIASCGFLIGALACVTSGQLRRFTRLTLTDSL